MVCFNSRSMLRFMLLWQKSLLLLLCRKFVIRGMPVTADDAMRWVIISGLFVGACVSSGIPIATTGFLQAPIIKYNQTVQYCGNGWIVCCCWQSVPGQMMMVISTWDEQEAIDRQAVLRRSSSSSYTFQRRLAVMRIRCLLIYGKINSFVVT